MSHLQVKLSDIEERQTGNNRDKTVDVERTENLLVDHLMKRFRNEDVGNAFQQNQPCEDGDSGAPRAVPNIILDNQERRQED